MHDQNIPVYSFTLFILERNEKVCSKQFPVLVLSSNRKKKSEFDKNDISEGKCAFEGYKRVKAAFLGAMTVRWGAHVLKKMKKQCLNHSDFDF